MRATVAAMGETAAMMGVTMMGVAMMEVASVGQWEQWWELQQQE
jgi:hypothetical protein